MSAAQILQKRGMAKVEASQSDSNSDGYSGLQWLRPFLQPYVLAGLGCHVLLTGLWLIVLTRVEVSLAFPVLSLSFVVIVSYSHLALGEIVTWDRWLGVGLIIVGVCLLAFGAAT